MDIERSRKRRRTEVVDIEDRLESLITRVGEKVEYSCLWFGSLDTVCFVPHSTSDHNNIFDDNLV